MLRRPVTTSQEDPYDALADAFAVFGRSFADAMRMVVEDIEARVAAAALRPTVEADSTVTVSVAEAARRLGISTSKFKQLVAPGEVRSIKVGDRRLIPVSALDAFVGDAEDEDSEVEPGRTFGRTLVAHAPKPVGPRRVRTR
jgi:excisionase family DNA binding protein